MMSEESVTETPESDRGRRFWKNTAVAAGLSIAWMAVVWVAYDCVARLLLGSGTRNSAVFASLFTWNVMLSLGWSRHGATTENRWADLLQGHVTVTVSALRSRVLVVLGLVALLLAHDYLRRIPAG